MPKRQPTAGEVSYLKTLPESDRLTEARKLLAAFDRSHRGVPIDACDVLIDALQGRAPALLHDLSENDGVGPASLYIRARLLTARGDVDASAESWERLLMHTPAPDALLILHA